ncbi:carboxylating nicotinate-nucleotide diphosphorylase [Pseudorhodoplanes sinuspersici]|uniref:Probable nicotinate-nucleotide pyrophosphorylase [carboxylating] n=1 Tax=Pseudorhodoplanes sinuspersici TaxID=1235591 RepID=A0A1W6ZJW7_9HYPH|nr:carboxylating nicotinate-nucleotide diphosphorylase [Pseudorhodoplanes sinuspersici]ARP97718.1 nicotinate-nucleotide diphosphorylase (carboxylating) [Pseudorhodoplanes sinuspersici]RKE68560.1 nicotinate-nucleotide pyrophosphorylase [carboxylating] [Pseudorhodoplanes sinuspersici]
MLQSLRGKDVERTSAASLYCPDAFISPLEIEDVVTRALAEDLGRAGDVTSVATVPEDAQAHAIVIARAAGHIAGLPVVESVMRRLAPDARIVAHARDGDAVSAKTSLMTVTGNARAVLAAERTALNFIGLLSGVATATASLVTKVAGTNARIVCTRKTTPGLRALQKYAVRCGGGFNHRFGLDDAVLIKDNHIAVAGGIRPALERAKSVVGHLVKIEIEVDNLDQLREVLATGQNTPLADVLLVDNFTVPMLKEAVALVGGRMVIEASGGITYDNVAEIATTGVDYISSGAITHSAPNLDIALDIEI